MQIINGYDPKAINEQTAVALGMFDGVHLGHKQIISKTVEYAKAKGLKSAVVTLTKHPRLLVQGSAPPLLTDLDSKIQIFKELGIDCVLLLDFTPELKDMSPEDYVKKFLMDTLKAKFISVGYNHHFGKNRAGGPDFLKKWVDDNNCELYLCEPVRASDEVVSSSRIREYVLEGNVKKAAALLGREYFIRGSVIKGDQIGRELGFPTANLKYPAEIAVPKEGVYSAKVKILNKIDDLELSAHSDNKGELFNAAVNIGLRPTFKDDGLKTIEAHILDFNEDIYDKEIEIIFIDRLRDEKKFDSKESLIEQIKSDISSVQG